MLGENKRHFNNITMALTFTAVFPLESRFRTVTDGFIVDDAAHSSIQANMVCFTNVTVDPLTTNYRRLRAVNLQIGYPSFVWNLVFDGRRREPQGY